MCTAYTYLLFLNDTAITAIYTYLPTLALHDALPLLGETDAARQVFGAAAWFDEVEAASASETGQIARADRAFRIAGDTPGVNAARARHALRAGRFDEAARVAEQAVAYPEGKIGRAHV